MAYCTVGTAGHIDHGKTALVKALTGVDTDRLKEEKARGLSIELGFAHFEVSPSGEGGPPLHISIIDVPGHEKFIRTMLAGTTGIDMVLFVVAADDSVMPQSREHLDIVRLLSIERAVFVISKIDRVDGLRVSEVKAEVEALIKGTVLEGSPIVSTSVETGEGICELRDLIALACSKIKSRERGPFFRLPVDRSFTIKGFGTVVTGTVASGVVMKNDIVSAFTAGSMFSGLRVRGIESAHSKVESVEAGARGALNLVNLPQGALSRGAMLADSALVDYLSDSLQSSSGRLRALQVDCSFEFLKAFDMKGLLKGKKRLKLFHLTGESLVSVRFPDKSSPGLGRLTLATPLLCLRGDRFILRDTATNTTVGGGTVLLPYYNPRLLRTLANTDYRAIKGDDSTKLLTALLGPREVGLKVAGLDYMLNLTLSDIIKNLSGFVLSGEFLLLVDRRDGLREIVLKVLEKFHMENPSKEGISVTDLTALLAKEATFSFALTGPGLIKVIVDEAVKEGKLKRSGSSLSLSGHSPSLLKGDIDIEKAVLFLFEPVFTVLKAERLYALPFKRGDIERVLSYLLYKGRLVKLKEDKFLLNAAIDEAHSKLESALSALAEISIDAGGASQGITVSEFRDILGTGRKMAMEILEYFDRELVTVRNGDYRVLRSGGLLRGGGATRRGCCAAGGLKGER